jgi:hypothetical protein
LASEVVASEAAAFEAALETASGDLPEIASEAAVA